MGKANCNENRELSEIITGLKKQMSATGQDLESPSTKENPEAEVVSRDVKLGCQDAIIALDLKRHFHQQRCPECQKED
jgi:hypothetical protein